MSKKEVKKEESVTEPVAAPAAEPEAGSTSVPAAEPVAEPVAKPVAELPAEPEAVPMAETVPQPLAESQSQPVTKPVVEKLKKLVRKPVAEPGAEPVSEPAAGLMTKPEAVPMAESVPQPQPLAGSEAQSVTKPVVEKLKKMVQKPVAEKMEEPVPKEPVAIDVSESLPEKASEKPVPTNFHGFGPPARFRQRTNPIDAEKYDFRATRTNLNNPKNLIEASIHLLMCGLAGGVMAVHEAYKECGIWTALGINLIMAAIISYCTVIMVWSAQKIYGRVHASQLTYPDVAEAAMLITVWPKIRKGARVFRYILECFLAFHAFLSCSVFILMLARNLKQLVDGQKTITDAGDPPLRVYILSLMLPCAVMCMVTDLKNLAPFALISDLYSFGIVFITLFFAFKSNTGSIWNVQGFKDVDGVFGFIGISVFTLECVTVALPIENNMDEPKKFHWVVLGTEPLVTFAMTVIGFFGYWTHGMRSVAPILVHYPFEPFPVTLKVFLCLMLYVIFAMRFYVAFDIEWFYLKRNHQVSNYWFWERLYRAIHVIIITFIAYTLPDVTMIMSFIGTLFTTPCIFFYPPFIELMLDWQYPGPGYLYWRLIKCIAIMLVGLVIWIGGTYYNIVSTIRIVRLKSATFYNIGFDAENITDITDATTPTPNLKP